MRVFLFVSLVIGLGVVSATSVGLAQTGTTGTPTGGGAAAPSTEAQKDPAGTPCENKAFATQAEADAMKIKDKACYDLRIKFKIGAEDSQPLQETEEPSGDEWTDTPNTPNNTGDEWTDTPNTPNNTGDEWTDENNNSDSPNPSTQDDQCQTGQCTDNEGWTKPGEEPKAYQCIDGNCPTQTPDTEAKPAEEAQTPANAREAVREAGYNLPNMTNCDVGTPCNDVVTRTCLAEGAVLGKDGIQGCVEVVRNRAAAPGNGWSSDPMKVVTQCSQSQKSCQFEPWILKGNGTRAVDRYNESSKYYEDTSKMVQQVMRGEAVPKFVDSEGRGFTYFGNNDLIQSRPNNVTSPLTKERFGGMAANPDSITIGSGRIQQTYGIWPGQESKAPSFAVEGVPRLPANEVNIPPGTAPANPTAPGGNYVAPYNPGTNVGTAPTAPGGNYVAPYNPGTNVGTYIAGYPNYYSTSNVNNPISNLGYIGSSLGSNIGSFFGFGGTQNNSQPTYNPYSNQSNQYAVNTALNNLITQQYNQYQQTLQSGANASQLRSLLSQQNQQLQQFSYQNPSADPTTIQQRLNLNNQHITQLQQFEAYQNNLTQAQYSRQFGQLTLQQSDQQWNALNTNGQLVSDATPGTLNTSVRSDLTTVAQRAESTLSGEYRFRGTLTRTLNSGSIGSVGDYFGSNVTHRLLLDLACDGTVDQTKDFTTPYTSIVTSDSGAQVLISEYMPVPENGLHCFSFSVDTNNVIPESNENNNSSGWREFIAGFGSGGANDTSGANLPSLNFEVSAHSAGYTSVTRDWTTSDITIASGHELVFRWNAPQYEKCIPLLSSLTPNSTDNLSPVERNTLTEQIDVHEHTGYYELRCSVGEQNRVESIHITVE